MYLLGIDNGGTVAKAAVVSPDGRELAVASRKTESLTPRAGWAEFDAEALWQATAAAVRTAIDKAGIPPDRIAAVGCTGHGNGVYLVDADGHPVRNAIFSADSRASSVGLPRGSTAWYGRRPCNRCGPDNRTRSWRGLRITNRASSNKLAGASCARITRA